MHLELLSEIQREAACYISGPVIITAGAGSGKTRTLTGKIAHLVNSLGFSPDKILAITFTNKAADEMKGRLEKITGRGIDEFPWVRTFHSACFKILKEHCQLLGYAKPLMIHDTSQQKMHLKKVLAELNLDSRYLNAAAPMISRAKNSGHPHRYLDLSGRLPRSREIYRRYNEMLESNNSVDFDDILFLVRDLLKNFHGIAKKYRESFDYILIDEFQDSNAIQNQIVDLLVRDGNLTVVGDDYQSVYKFRGADPCHFINFPKNYPDAKVFRLEENFRSTAPIVEASDLLISRNCTRIEKRCFSRRSGPPVERLKLANADEEAWWVADKCWKCLKLDGIPLEDIAILCRTKFTSLPFERALRAAGLPYVMVGAQGFFQRKEVQDIHAYLVCAVNVQDDISFERIINIPRRGIGPGTVKKLYACKERDMSLQEAARKAIRTGVVSGRVAANLNTLLLLLDSIRHEKPESAMRTVIEQTSYERHLQDFSDDEEDFAGRKDNIKQMIFDASSKSTIPDYLEDASLIRDDQDLSDKKTGIRLSTIHGAKGLEFRIVFVVALEEGLLPHRRSIGSDIEQQDKEGIEEERRLMYVAMTRASERLYLTCAMHRRGETMLPSRFLNESRRD